MNYGEVKTQFQGLLNRRDMTTAQRDSFVEQAITRAQRKLEIPPMEKSITVTTDASFESLAIPADFIRIKAITVDTNELLQRDLETVLKEGAVTGENPRMYARRGNQWIVGPTPPEGTVFRIDYYAEFPALSADEDTNFLTEVASDCIVYGALSYAADWFTDPRQGAFEQRFLNIIAELNEQSDSDELLNSQVSPAYSFPEEDGVC